MSSECVIDVQHISKIYRIYDRPHDRLMQMLTMGKVRRYREFWALRDVSLQVFRGECVGIIGTNGSGKSTLLQIVCGTVAPSAGTVTVQGRLSALLELGAGFNPEFTGLENVFLNGAILGLTETEVQNRLDRILGFADIGDFVYQPVKTYSSGMYVRLAFAVAVNVSPDVLIVDEALAVGDNLFQKRCFAKIEELRNSGVTLLFVSHDQESVRMHTSRALVLDNGVPYFLGSSGDSILKYRTLLHEKENSYLARLAEEAKNLQRGALPPVLPEILDDAVVETVPELALEVAAVEGDDVAADESVNDDNKRFGDADARITQVTLCNSNGDSCNVFCPGDELRFQLRVKARKTLTHLNVGVRIRNKQGIKIHSWGTLNQDISVWSGRRSDALFWDRTFESGSEFTVELSCRCTLGSGFYEVQSYVTQEEDRYFSQQRVLDWADEAAFFSVTVIPTEYFFGGICDLQMVAKVLPAETSAMLSVGAA